MLPDASLPGGTLLDDLVAAALAAGAAILAVPGRDIVATEKADGSPVTQADLAANDTILQLLAEKFSDIPVITEERTPDKAAAASRYVFLVDPLDGTKDFLNGNGEYTVNIALIDRQTPVAGVVYAPALGVIYAGAVGDGARRANVANGMIGVWRPIQVAAPSNTLRAVTSRSHPSAETRKYIDELHPGELKAIGSSLKFCVVAAGEADIYPRMDRTMEWDTAAGDAVLRAAGGQVLTFEGAPLHYNKRKPAGEYDGENPWFIAFGHAAPGMQPRSGTIPR